MTSTDEHERTDRPPHALAPPSRRVPRDLVLAATLAVPFVVAAVALARPTWYAIDDYALIELRVRDVTSSHAPLVGLGGRIEHDGVPGSHPGPIAFYLLALPYRLFGGSSWALQAATLTLGLTAVGLTVWIARRRAGTAGAIAAVAGTGVLLVAYGPERWALPWNPYLPLLWWPVVLVAAWSVLCRDWPMLPVLVVAASFCAQTHISYLGLVGGLGALAVAWVVRSAVAAGRAPDAGAGARPAGRPGRGAALAAALALALWLPPLIDEVRNDPGNASIIAGQFTDDDIPAAGWRTGAEVMLARLDPVDLVTGDDGRVAASPLGLAFLAAWAAAAAAAVVRRHEVPADLLRLHLVAGVAAALGVVSLSRVQGPMFPYLTLWSWGTAAVMAAAAGWTVAAVWSRPPAPARVTDGRPATGPLGAVLALGLVVAATVGAAGAESPEANRARRDAAVIPVALDALEDGRVPGFDAEDRYLVQARDAYSGSLSSITLLDEMDKRGFDARVGDGAAHAAGSHRVRDAEDATALITLATGQAVEDLRAAPDAVELAHTDLTSEDAAEAARQRARLIEGLEAEGSDDLVPMVDGNLLALVVDPGMPEEGIETLQRLFELGGPTAIFVQPGPAA